ncbi:hypothetical protein [Niallia sp. NCCP-28]|uniref:hypothetical protein n=1 Tax=Niallia sp. NCCP-28 TaxID=2934712 RepID=UPI0020862835|nr:hypothetical protein [Niallia sp. NCCP-28]GKU81664.1 hypothetical protein NCCP28_10600 [Niallia sp. NCCP-28]
MHLKREEQEIEGELKTYHIADKEVIIYLPPTYKKKFKNYPAVYIFMMATI